MIIVFGQQFYLYARPPAPVTCSLCWTALLHKLHKHCPDVFDWFQIGAIGWPRENDDTPVGKKGQYRLCYIRRGIVVLKD